MVQFGYRSKSLLVVTFVCVLIALGACAAPPPTRLQTYDLPAVHNSDSNPYSLVVVNMTASAESLASISNNLLGNVNADEFVDGQESEFTNEGISRAVELVRSGSKSLVCAEQNNLAYVIFNKTIYPDLVEDPSSPSDASLPSTVRSCGDIAGEMCEDCGCVGPMVTPTSCLAKMTTDYDIISGP